MVPATVRQFFVKNAIEPCPIVVAVSGGADSSALLFALAELRQDGFVLFCAHVNHRLREAESDEDEGFVRELCRSLEVPFTVADGTLDGDRVRHLGVEAAAREVRYARLAETRSAYGASWVATAHQKNDQAETVLMRLITGSGIAGLRGIHPVREDGFVRPLLDVTRDEIESYMRERGVTPRRDSSNDDLRFLRNRVRRTLGELGGIDNLAALADQARAQWPIFERAIDDAEQRCAEVRADETRFRDLPGDLWLRQALLHRHIRRLDPAARNVSAADLSRVAAEAEAIRRLTVTRSLELVRRGSELILRHPPDAQPPFEVELTPESPAYIPEIQLTLQVVSGSSGHPGAQRIQLPPGAEPRFVVRSRRQGDRFQPLGLSGSKKLKDFLIDRKIPAETRDRVPLLIWNEEIVWIAGIEVSDRFKVTSPAGMIFEVWMEGSGAEKGADQTGFQR